METGLTISGKANILHTMIELTSVFQSLEEDTRLRILALLMEAGELCVCDLIAVLQLPQSTVSRHLSHLRNVGWVQDRREGVWIHYSIAKRLGPLQVSLMAVLREHLSKQEVVRGDIEKLESMAKGSRCA